MDVSITGKALAPLPFHYFSSPNKYEMNTKAKQIYLPLSRQYGDSKSSMQIVLESKLQKEEQSQLSLTPALRNMTLSETYSFARAQLRAYPMHHMHQRRNITTPSFSYTKANPSDNASCEKDEEDKIETSRSLDAPRVSRTTSSEHPKPRDCSQIAPADKSRPFKRTSQKRQAKSACGFRKTRRKSGRRKKHNTTLSRSYLPENLNHLPRDFPIKSRLVATKTHCSVSILKRMPEKPTKDRDIILPSYSKPQREGNFASAGEGLKLPKTQAIVKRSTESRPTDSSLLTSLDSSLSGKERNGKQLSMRIQLIHRYGNEDVIGKHMEMQRKKEAADRHEKKNLEHQANERLKEIQRSKIYALNALMTRLEQEQFEEYKQSTNV